MKAVFLSFLVFFLTIFSSCNKKKYPESVVDSQSTFYFKGTVDNAPVSFGAGLNNYFMYSSYKQDSSGIYHFIGDLKPLNCAGNCANSVQIQINDFKISALNAPVIVDSSLQTKSYPFNNISGTAYDVSFQSFYNKTAGSYLWDFGDGNTTTSANPVHRYLSSGTYQVCLTIKGTNSCVGSICNSQKIGVSGNPCRTSITSGVASGNTIAFYQTTAGNSPFRYLWDFGDGKSDTLPSPVHTYAIRGSYPVSLRVTDANNNQATATFNTLTQNDISSCAANYNIVSVIPMPGYLSLSTIGFTWADANGSVYTTANLPQPASSFFQIVSVEDYHDNENGQKTKKLHLKLKCDVTNGSKVITVDNAEAVICVAYH